MARLARSLKAAAAPAAMAGAACFCLTDPAFVRVVHTATVRAGGSLRAHYRCGRCGRRWFGAAARVGAGEGEGAPHGHA